MASSRPVFRAPNKERFSSPCCCLSSAIGYNIGHIEKWAGTGLPPPTMAAKILVLVLGGSTPTDPLILEPFPTLTGVAVTHYQYKMVGSLLLSALKCSSGAFPEVFQSYFEQIFECTMEGIEVCRRAGCTIGKAWQRWESRAQRHVG
jgi:hypothetical protein